MTEDEMVEWHHRLNDRELEQAPGASDGRGSPAQCSPWRCTESALTEYLNRIALSLQSCPTLCDPMNCSLPGSSVHGVL